MPLKTGLKRLKKFKTNNYKVNNLTYNKFCRESIKQNESVFLRGFGTFLAKERKEKTGRNISKNTTIIIPAHHIPAFKPAKIFMQEVKKNVK